MPEGICNDAVALTCHQQSCLYPILQDVPSAILGENHHVEGVPKITQEHLCILPTHDAEVAIIASSLPLHQSASFQWIFRNWDSLCLSSQAVSQLYFGKSENEPNT
eukprot:6042797-Amphidinium_carterae.1